MFTGNYYEHLLSLPEQLLRTLVCFRYPEKLSPSRLKYHATTSLKKLGKWLLESNKSDAVQSWSPLKLISTSRSTRNLTVSNPLRFNFYCWYLHYIPWWGDSQSPVLQSLIFKSTRFLTEEYLAYDLLCVKLSDVPLSAAKCSAVRPSLSKIFAPCSTRNFTISNRLMAGWVFLSSAII